MKLSAAQSIAGIIGGCITAIGLAVRWVFNAGGSTAADKRLRADVDELQNRVGILESETVKDREAIAKQLAVTTADVKERLAKLETSAQFQNEMMTAHGRTLERIESLTVLIQKEGCWRAEELHREKK